MIKNTRDMVETVVKHILKQGRPSRSEEGLCVYKNAEGLSCAVGCLISSEEYDKSFEGVAITHTMEYKFTNLKSNYEDLPSSVKTVMALQDAVSNSTGLRMTELRLNILANLQSVHDATYSQGYIEGVKESIADSVDSNFLPKYTLEFIK